METGWGILGALMVVIIVSAGCLSAIFPYPPLPAPAQTPAPTPVPTTISPVSTIPVSQMALQPADMPSDYILKDRSDIPYLQIDQMSRNLGWRAGYEVIYYRLNEQQYDLTEVSQVIDLFTPANMNMVFNEQEDAVNAGGTGTTQIYELPCPSMGDHTFAYRETDTQSPLLTTYAIIFTKKDVYEELTMSGTTTDFETLKNLTLTASGRIQ
jgi:hypothetical protein